ncbi:MAG: ROK family transcriptional regulator, partial [Propionibacteriaceae bacterium]|nr:ROK family transcriptional regulator [Propionibacteriaceae bacterium]
MSRLTRPQDVNDAKQPPIARLLVPPLVRMSDRAAVMSVLLQLIASHAATTRPQLAQATGLARSTIGSCLAELERRGLITSAGADPASNKRGRPAESILISPNAGLVLVIDLTPHHIGVAMARLDQQLLAYQRIDFMPEKGPTVTLDAAVALARETMHSAGLEESSLRTIVVSFPGPVDVKRGVPVRPPIMPGWDSFPIAAYMTAEFGCRCHVDNDANLIALGEARVLPEDQCPLLVVKVGTGIGGGLVTAKGELHHGADGAACDIGHLSVVGATDVICSCGNSGCIEAVASAEAITKEFRAATGNPNLTQSDLRQAARSGDPVAIRLIRDGAARIGRVVASLVHVYNPARIVITGPLTEATDDLLAGIRSVAYQRALPLATRNLTLAHSVIGAMGGVVGAV